MRRVGSLVAHECRFRASPLFCLLGRADEPCDELVSGGRLGVDYLPALAAEFERLVAACEELEVVGEPEFFVSIVEAE